MQDLILILVISCLGVSDNPINLATEDYDVCGLLDVGTVVKGFGFTAGSPTVTWMEDRFVFSKLFDKNQTISITTRSSPKNIRFSCSCFPLLTSRSCTNLRVDSTVKYPGKGCRLFRSLRWMFYWSSDNFSRACGVLVQ
ncbi:hypothetical protein GGS26DRAFT_366504 [Hypomontagnella submonticulosa]|nr:hypothetical protein GGS26DRAFT_366504 [Hypomontagnella submonticulosa]